MITLELDFKKFHRGRGFWKFNASLLKDHEYVSKIKEAFKRVVAQYGIVEGDEHFYVNASVEQIQEFYTNKLGLS